MLKEKIANFKIESDYQENNRPRINREFNPITGEDEGEEEREDASGNFFLC